MLTGNERARVETLARRASRAGKQTEKQVKGWREGLGDETVDRILDEQTKGKARANPDSRQGRPARA